MRSVHSLVVAGAMALLSTVAQAADVPIAPPPPQMYAPVPPPIVDDFGGWYLRGDIGMTNQRVKSLNNVLYDLPGYSISPQGMAFDGGMLFGVGVGYQFNSWLRADVTAEYRNKANFHGLDIISVNGLASFTDEYRASKSEILALVNLYADLGTWWCITPFIGVGVGGARTTIASFIDVNTPFNSVAYAKDESKYTFAWALHAGLAYKLSNSLTMELAYRYVNLGSARSGDIMQFDGVNNVYNPMHFRDITSHDLKLGVRWLLNPPVPVYAPPLMTKG